MTRFMKNVKVFLLPNKISHDFTIFLDSLGRGLFILIYKAIVSFGIGTQNSKKLAFVSSDLHGVSLCFRF